MAKYFGLLCVAVMMLLGIAMTAEADGLADFVAVADRSSSAIANPAGLANLTTSALDWEHRFTDRDKGNMDSDDLLIYTAPGNPGAGALFFAYSQDLNAGKYWRTTSYGYAYGWRVSDQANLGLTLKGVNLSSFDSATVTQLTTDTSVVFDFGAQLQVDEHLRLGLAVHNIGRNMGNSHFNYESAVGAAYRIEKFIIAVEINDYLNEGGNPLYRLGCRYEVSKAVQPWVYLFLAEDGHLGGSLGLEYQNSAHLKIDLSWYVYHNDTQNINSIKATVGYCF